jgi:methylenetetrahydrofolate--tRNA-(uracil-5-)-methyltransferase
MGANLGILPELTQRPRDKRERAAAYAARALDSMTQYIKENMGD